MRRITITSVLFLGLVAATSCVPPTAELQPYPGTITTHTVASRPSVSFANSGDVIGDSTPELVVSAFGTPLSAGGSVTIYSRGATLDDWTPLNVVTPADNIAYPNDTAIADVSGDGLTDLIVSGGFFQCNISGNYCGSLQWFEQVSPGSFTRHNIVTPNSERFYHRSILTDVNLDGITDVVTVGETADSAQTEWFEGTTGPNRFNPTPHVIGSGGGSLPVVDDVDGDGDDDVVSPQYFSWGNAFVWFERTANPSPATPAGTWVRHNFNAQDIGKGFEIQKVANLFGDGVDRWIGTNHQNQIFNSTAPSALYLFNSGATPADPRTATELSQGVMARPSFTQLAPGLIGTGDLNGDGRIDVVMSGDGDERIFAITQNPDHSFTTSVIASGMGQAGGAEVTDFDQDGNPEAVFTSYEAGVVRLYEFE